MVSMWDSTSVVYNPYISSLHELCCAHGGFQLGDLHFLHELCTCGIRAREIPAETVVLFPAAVWCVRCHVQRALSTVNGREYLLCRNCGFASRRSLVRALSCSASVVHVNRPRRRRCALWVLLRAECRPPVTSRGRSRSCVLRLSIFFSSLAVGHLSAI